MVEYLAQHHWMPKTQAGIPTMIKAAGARKTVAPPYGVVRFFIVCVVVAGVIRLDKGNPVRIRYRRAAVMRVAV